MTRVIGAMAAAAMLLCGSNAWSRQADTEVKQYGKTGVLEAGGLFTLKYGKEEDVTHTGFGVAPILGYFFQDGIKIIVAPNFSYVKGTTAYTIGTTTVSTESKVTSFGATAGAAFVLLDSKKFFPFAGLVAGFDYDIKKSSTNGGAESKTTTLQVGVGPYVGIDFSIGKNALFSVSLASLAFNYQKEKPEQGDAVKGWEIALGARTIMPTFGVSFFF